MATAREHLSLSQPSPCVVTHGIQTTKPTESPATRHYCSLYALQANSAAIDARTAWHLMVRGRVPCPPNMISYLLQAQVNPQSQHEDPSTREPEPEMALTQSTEEAFALPSTPASVIIIDDIPIGSSLPPLLSRFLPRKSQLPPPLILIMRVGRNLRTCDRPS
ncbi:hypothetical protein O181_063859 [Austropuccinia psidii MF-1]|uniref:Uncharacterized protein n=1 Tax=Austropuccinia psidii MF-1 TaxID=1389203 RepID=A0A9Q3EMY4_9BASI|nr:hypothetical protein [Austropuccinia psidii MF-1]